MATVVATTTVRTSTPPPPHLSINTSKRGTPAPVLNKHVPFCSPGPQPSPRQIGSPLSPSDHSPELVETTSLTYPPSGFEKVVDNPPIYSISAARLQQAFDHLAGQPLPTARQVFPWLHGLHVDNQLQLAFFTGRKKALRKTPKCMRGLTIVKAGGDLLHSKIKGAVAPNELLRPLIEGPDDCNFWDIDPRDGFGVRNFQIQACKMATMSDIVVYGDDSTDCEEVMDIAKRIASAQSAWRKKTDALNVGDRLFNTFILSDDYTTVEADHPELIALDSEGCLTTKVIDFFYWERLEMCTMSAPTEICHNVWLGPTPDSTFAVPSNAAGSCSSSEFDLYIEASDLAQTPDAQIFKALEHFLSRRDNSDLANCEIPVLEFPGSGAILPPTWSQSEVDSLMATCEWMYTQANSPRPQRKRRDSKFSPSPDRDADGTSFMQESGQPNEDGRKILLHCTDGYTESSLLAIAYYMYAEGVTAHDAWLQLHREKGRNFFAYSSDVALLRAIQPRILQASPKHAGEISQLCPSVPEWFEKMDGSFPSRILPYMYLGNLNHANNPGLLKELGIGQILSVGEPVSWSKEVLDFWPKESFLFVDNVQDNGVDPLIDEFARCLDFIATGRRLNTATLVHCRVGVSRSATICIAEVMSSLSLSFSRAYCFVRARRLNVIIQPHLRFSYELLKWEEVLAKERGQPIRRELEWAVIAHEIAAMNRPYARQN